MGCGCIPTKDFQFIYLSSGAKVGVIGLKEIMEKYHNYGKPTTPQTALEIVERLKEKNYIVPAAENEYKNAVLIEYRKYIENKDK